jgi:CheY-like chemotaxis protein
VVIAVRDNGIGIEPEMQARVFDVFTQSRQALDRSQGGLGLGLAIVQSLVRVHGGTVEVFSEGRGRGATFTLRLPYVAMPEIAPPEDGKGSRVRAEATTPEKSRRILIVDDNCDSAEMLAAALSALGYATHAVFDAPGALEAARHFLPDVALLDIGLPVMSGYELARQLREAPGSADVSLVAVTGYGQPGDRVATAEAGFDGHLVKPIDVDAVAQLIAALLEERSRRKLESR